MHNVPRETPTCYDLVKLLRLNQLTSIIIIITGLYAIAVYSTCLYVLYAICSTVLHVTTHCYSLLSLSSLSLAVYGTSGVSDPTSDCGPPFLNDHHPNVYTVGLLSWWFTILVKKDLDFWKNTWIFLNEMLGISKNVCFYLRNTWIFAKTVNCQDSNPTI